MLKDCLVNTSNFSKSALHCFMSLIVVTLIFGLSANTVYSESNKDSEEQAPLHVISDKMVALRDTSMVEFIGNVKATRLESILLADSIKVFFNEKSETKDETAQSNIKKIVATGNVRGTDNDRKAFADKAVYTAKDDVLILTGKAAKLLTGTSYVTGKKITWFRKLDKVIVETDGTNRVEALFNPEDDFTEKQ